MAMDPPTVTHQEKQVNFKTKVFYEPTDLKKARALFMERLSKYKPEVKFVGPIRLVVKWLYPIKGKRSDGEYKASKPDLDNAQKLLQDCMTKVGFWKDDAQIASLVCEKFWAKTPGIYIRIDKLEVID